MFMDFPWLPQGIPIMWLQCHKPSPRHHHQSGAPSRASLRREGSRGGGRAGGGATPPCASAKGRRGARDSGMLRREGSFQALDNHHFSHVSHENPPQRMGKDGENHPKSSNLGQIDGQNHPKHGKLKPNELESLESGRPEPQALAAINREVPAFCWSCARPLICDAMGTCRETGGEQTAQNLSV